VLTVLGIGIARKRYMCLFDLIKYQQSHINRGTYLYNTCEHVPPSFQKERDKEEKTSHGKGELAAYS